MGGGVEQRSCCLGCLECRAVRRVVRQGCRLVFIPRLAVSGPGITLHSAGDAVQPHAIMRQAKDFDPAVRGDRVSHQVARPGDAVPRGDEMTAEAERVDTAIKLIGKTMSQSATHRQIEAT